MKRFLVTFGLTIPFAILTFILGSLMGAKGVDLIGGTAIMSLVSMYLLWLEDFSVNPNKKSDNSQTAE